MTVYQAIAQMRATSERGGEFSFMFMSYSETRQKSEGIVSVPRARLAKRDDSKVANADIMLSYLDLDTGEQRRVYQPLLMMFNGQKLELT